jgi:hypothetical protein
MRCLHGVTPKDITRMTQLLEHAIAEVQKLPGPAQDSIAALILEQIADDHAWDDAFARSQDQLARLAAKVREDIAAGRLHRSDRKTP